MKTEPIETTPHRWRRSEPAAWTFHRSTARWMFNAASGVSPHQLPGREHPAAPWIPLPSSAPIPTAVDAVIAGRVSCRAFAPTPIALDTLAAILSVGYGIENRSAAGDLVLFDRPVPSAGGLYPLEVSLLVRGVTDLPAGVYHYVPAADGLERLRSGALPHRFLTYLFMGQQWAADAALVVVLSAVPGRTLTKYRDRGYRYLLLEAGHVMQNINLACSALGLGSVNIGGFYDDELAGLIRVDPEQEFPVYASAIGRPSPSAQGDRMKQRALTDVLGSGV